MWPVRAAVLKHPIGLIREASTNVRNCTSGKYSQFSVQTPPTADVASGGHILFKSLTVKPNKFALTRQQLIYHVQHSLAPVRCFIVKVARNNLTSLFTDGASVASLKLNYGLRPQSQLKQRLVKYFYFLFMVTQSYFHEFKRLVKCT